MKTPIQRWSWRRRENVQESTNRGGAVGHAGRTMGYAEWVALGAIAAGTVGAIVAATRCGRGAHSSPLDYERPDSALLTAPHGDKLGAIR
jgi:hypothetical protein